MGGPDVEQLEQMDADFRIGALQRVDDGRDIITDLGGCSAIGKIIDADHQGDRIRHIAAEFRINPLGDVAGAAIVGGRSGAGATDLIGPPAEMPFG